MSDEIVSPSLHPAIDSTLVRMRRLRRHPKLRELIRENRLSIEDLVLPVFITDGQKQQQLISSMPNHFRWSVDKLAAEIKSIVDLKIPAVLLFGLPKYKDAQGSASWQKDGVVQRAIQEIKNIAPQLLVIVDLCFCEYTDHGHCGVIEKIQHGQVDVDNDHTLSLLVKQVLSLAEAGADVIAPSGMMDGMVAAVRQGLDQAGFSHLPILSYAAKYASAFYGPFREATDCAPQMGDRRSYQMDPANGREAIREVELDVLEGADLLMVKPAQPYLDVIYRIKSEFPNIPLAAYQVSGEYAMIKAAAEKGWVDEEKVMMESLLGIKRAGADFIITYFAKDVARVLNR